MQIKSIEFVDFILKIHKILIIRVLKRRRERIRTAVQGFADLYLTTRPPGFIKFIQIKSMQSLMLPIH